MTIKAVFLAMFFLIGCDALVPVRRDFVLDKLNTINCIKNVMREVVPEFRQIYVAETSDNYFKFEWKNPTKIVGDVKLSTVNNKPEIAIDGKIYAFGGTLSQAYTRKPYEKQLELVEQKVREKCN